MKNYVDEGRTITTPNKLVQNEGWQGLFYTAIDTNGEGVYAIGEQVMSNGGWTVDDILDLGDGVYGAEVACNANKNISLSNSNTCTFKRYENNFFTINGKLGVQDENKANLISSWNENNHGRLLGIFDYDYHTLIITNENFYFDNREITTKYRNYNYWISVPDIINKVLNYINNNNFNYDYKNGKISYKLGTYLIYIDGDDGPRTNYYSPDDNVNKGSVYNLHGEFLSKADETYKKGTNKKIIKLIGPPMGEENSHIRIENNVSYTYHYQQFLNGSLYRYENFYNIFPNTYYTYGLIDNYQRNTDGLGLPSDDPDFDNYEYINQSFNNDKIVQQEIGTTNVTHQENGKYLCNVGINKYVKEDDTIILYLIGLHGFLVEAKEIVELAPELIFAISKGLLRTGNEVTSGELYFDDFKELYEHIKSFNKEEAYKFLSQVGDEAKKAVYNELYNETKICPARNAYISGRMTGIIGTSIIGYLSGASKAKKAKNIKKLNSELKLVKNNTSKDLPISKRLTIIKKIPCVVSGITGQGIGLQSNSCIIDFNGVKNYIKLKGELPPNYVTKSQAKKLGWDRGKDLSKFAPGRIIGGDRYMNYPNSEGIKLLPDKIGRRRYEADIEYISGKRNAKRLFYSNDGLFYKTIDHGTTPAIQL